MQLLNPFTQNILYSPNLLNSKLTIMSNYGLFQKPWILYLIWFGLFLLFIFIGIPLLDKGHSGGEQIPLISLGYALYVLIYGAIVISIAIPFLSNAWFKKYWYINISIGILCIVFLLYIGLFNR
jgi:hypothetical protein